MTLDDMRRRWLDEENLYAEVAKRTEDQLRFLIQNKGIYAEIHRRTKDIDSLIKKAIRKKYENPYDEIIDKAGVRVVVRFLDEIEPICQIIRENFTIVKEDNKADQLEPSEFGYLGIHFDTLTNEHTRPSAAGTDLPCEIQVHTLCQNVWAGQSHILAYKSLVNIPRKIQRILHRASALLEATDQSFNDGYAGIIGHPEFDNAKFLVELEKDYFKYVAKEYDTELSLRTIACVLKSYPSDVEDAIQKIRVFSKDNDEALRRIYDQYTKINERSAFLFQPEALAIFERLETDRYALKKAWEEEELPIGELIRIGEVWGIEIQEE